MSKENNEADKEILEQTEQCEEEITPTPATEPDMGSELLELKVKYDELFDKHIRTLAEYDNYKKRTQKEKDELYTVAVCDTLERILPVLDNLERAAEADNSGSPLREGVCMVIKQLFEIMEKMNVSPIDAVGFQFNPVYHNAVMHIEDKTKKEGEIVEQFVKGYKLGEKVIRHSMVKVAN